MSVQVWAPAPGQLKTKVPWNLEDPGKGAGPARCSAEDANPSTRRTPLARTPRARLPTTSSQLARGSALSPSVDGPRRLQLLQWAGSKDGDDEGPGHHEPAQEQNGTKGVHLPALLALIHS